MTIAVVPFSARYQAAAAAFNERMRRAHAPTAFLLPRRARAVVQNGAVVITQHLAVDGDEDEVRGGMLCQEYPAVVSGTADRVINISAPLSEGIVDSRYMLVGPLLLKHALRMNPRAFVVGMGKPDNPLPRLLKAMGWRLTSVPFYFRILRAGPCLRHLGPLRATRGRRVASAIASRTGIAGLLPILAHGRSGSAAAAGFESEAVQAWDGEADTAWRAFAPRVSFGVDRTREVLPFFYPLDGTGPRAWLIRRNGVAYGWFGLLLTHMAANPYFGDLTVATLTDCVGSPDAIGAGVRLATAQARRYGADILITNQQHVEVIQSCRAAGWRRAPSNFLFAASPALSADLRQETIYITRRDGDGLANLN